MSIANQTSEPKVSSPARECSVHGLPKQADARPTPTPDSSKVVCRCHNVTRAAIRSSIANTDRANLDSVMRETGAGTGCGACQCRVQRMILGKSPDCGAFGFCEACRMIQALCQCDDLRVGACA